MPTIIIIHIMLIINILTNLSNPFNNFRFDESVMFSDSLTL